MAQFLFLAKFVKTACSDRFDQDYFRRQPILREQRSLAVLARVLQAASPFPCLRVPRKRVEERTVRILERKLDLLAGTFSLADRGILAAERVAPVPHVFFVGVAKSDQDNGFILRRVSHVDHVKLEELMIEYPFRRDSVLDFLPADLAREIPVAGQVLDQVVLEDSLASVGRLVLTRPGCLKIRNRHTDADHGSEQPPHFRASINGATGHRTIRDRERSAKKFHFLVSTRPEPHIHRSANSRPIDREPQLGLELSHVETHIVRGELRHAIVGSEPSTSALTLPLLSGRGGRLRVRRQRAAMRNNDAPRAARRWISGLFLSASASLRRIGRKSVPAMREVRPDKPQLNRGKGRFMSQREAAEFAHAATGKRTRLKPGQYLRYDACATASNRPAAAWSWPKRSRSPGHSRHSASM